MTTTYYSILATKNGETLHYRRRVSRHGVLAFLLARVKGCTPATAQYALCTTGGLTVSNPRKGLVLSIQECLPCETATAEREKTERRARIARNLKNAPRVLPPRIPTLYAVADHDAAPRALFLALAYVAASASLLSTVAALAGKTGTI